MNNMETNGLTENLQKWLAIDNRLKLINESAKKLREAKAQLTKAVCEYMKTNNLTDKKISTPTGEIRMVEKKEYTPLTFTYVELCLDNMIEDKDLVEKIMAFIREERDESTIQDLRHYTK